MNDRPLVPVMVAPFDLGALSAVEPAEPVAPPEVSPPPASRRDRRLAAKNAPVVSSSEAAPAPRRRPRRRWWLVALVGLVAVMAAGGVFVDVRLSAAIPDAVVTSSVGAPVQVAGAAHALPWAVTGQSAISVPSIGVNVPSAPEQPVPIASLTKMMTAFVILQDHPLALGQEGPNITMTQVDVDDFNNDTVQDQANAQVAVGEVLSERQLLGGLLVHSANDFADALARWDAGSVPNFVAKMNFAASRLGMRQTHYNDTSGFDPASVSTASDQLRVAGPDMNNLVFASLVKMTSITLPVAGTVSTYTPLLGFDGVIGVKSGFTSQAGGCDVVAVVRLSHGLPVLILGAVTGQQGPEVLRSAAAQALTLTNSVGLLIGTTPIMKPGTVVAHVTAAGHTVTATVRGSAKVLSWPGVHVTRVFERDGTIRPGAVAGTRIGSVIITVGTQRIVLPVRLTGTLPKESLSQRLF